MPFSSFFVTCYVADDSQTKRYLISLERNLKNRNNKKRRYQFLKHKPKQKFQQYKNAKIELNRTKVKYARYNVINYITFLVSLQ